jgi:hypothetical protein
MKHLTRRQRYILGLIGLIILNFIIVSSIRADEETAYQALVVEKQTMKDLYDAQEISGEEYDAYVQCIQEDSTDVNCANELGDIYN